MNDIPDSLVQKDFSGGFAPGQGPGWQTLLSSSGGFSTSGVSVNINSVLQLSAAHACLDRIASDIAKLPVILQKRTTGGQWVREPEHYLLDLLHKPNVRNSGFELKYQIVYSYQALGNGFGVVVYGSNGVPQAIIPMPIWKPTMIVEKMSGAIEYTCTNPMFRYYKTSKPSETTARRTIAEDEMIHIRRQSLDGVRGTSAITTASEVFALGIAAQSLVSSTFKNGANFNFIICTPMKLNQAQIEQTQNDFLRNSGGIANSGKPPIMHGGTTIEKVSMSLAESQLLDMRSHIDAEICRVLGVPHSLLGIATGDSETYKNLEQDMTSYVEGTLLNIITPFESMLDQRLLFDPNGRRVPQGGAVRGEYRFQFDTSALLRADKQSRYTAYKLGVDSHILTPNEARAEEGLPPSPDGKGDEFPDNAKTINLNRSGSGASDDVVVPDADEN